MLLQEVKSMPSVSLAGSFCHTHRREVRACQAREMVRGVVVIDTHVALDAAHHPQQLAREVRPHVGPQPGHLRVCSAPRVRRSLQKSHCRQHTTDGALLYSRPPHRLPVA